MNLRSLSLNQATVETSPTADVLASCERTGVEQVSLWRHKYIDCDARVTREAADGHGLRVSSLCRGGFFTGTRPLADEQEDNRRAVDEAAVLGAPVLVLVCGPLVDGDVRSAEAAICRGIDRLLPYARSMGVTLAVEPFHPMLAAERSAVVTLDQACRVVESVGADGVGIALDTYHVWWDPELEQSIRRAAPHLTSVHVADWLVPTTDILSGRGLPGDGVIDLVGILARIERLGFRGPVEVEVLSPSVWAEPLHTVVSDVLARMTTLLAEVETVASADERVGA